MLKLSVLTFHEQRNGDDNIKMHLSKKNIFFVRVFLSAINRTKKNA